MLVIALIAISIGCSLSAWFAFRTLVHDSPLLVAIAVVLTLALGFASFAIAKLSVIRRDTLVSFGHQRMSTKMKRYYVLGYFTMGCGSMLAASFVVVA
jgi:hypothetical protein